MGDAAGSELTPAEARDLRRLAGFMVAASTDYCVPGADDAAIFADIVSSLGRAVVQCYYRDDRVPRSLGLEPGPPFQRRNMVEPGDWSLLDPVRNLG